jgi:hypothetical protein
MTRTRFVAAIVLGALCTGTWCLHAIAQQQPVQRQQPQPGAVGQPGVGDSGQPVPIYGPPPPATRLEAIASQKGIVLTKGYTDVGELQADDGSRVRLTAVHFRDARGSIEQGLAVTLEQRGNDTGPVVVYVDLDELDGLSDALDALAKMEATASPLNNAEGVYRTRGDLEVTNHTSNGSRIVTIRATQIILPSGQVLQSSATLRPARLGEIRQQIATAKETLQHARELQPAGPAAK